MHRQRASNAFIIIILAFAIVASTFNFARARAARTAHNASSADITSRMTARRVPNIDFNLDNKLPNAREAAPEQLAALDALKTRANAPEARVRWNDFAGSPDVISGLRTAPSTESPEATARSFVADNSTLFGVGPDALKLVEHKEALGGHLLRFQQRAGDMDVAGGGIGFFMNRDKQIRMVLGSTFRSVSAPDTSALTSAVAAARAEADIARYAVQIPSGYEHIFTPALNQLAQEIAPVLRAPRLNIFPTADGYRLAWDVITFSRNPFGLFVSQVDAQTGEILSRENLVRSQSSNPLPYTADIYPSTPAIKNYDTGELELVGGAPKGLERVTLRNVNPGTNATAVDGILSGKHALVRNVLASKQPFAQAAAGTFHFRTNNAPVEAHPNETDDLAEPSEHFDTVNMYFFINYLLEYVDDIHVRADSVHSRVGEGDFPNSYPNSDRPLVGLVHMPNAPGVLGAEPDTSSPDALLRSLLGLDNAFSVPATQTVDTPAGPQKIVVNPTLYGHGYWLNDLAKDGPVAYHEGMHSVSTVIAGLEGAPEGGALNEAQADLWAYAITGDDSIGAHSIKGAIYRRMARDAGRDPNSLAWIRSARSSLKYSQLGTDGNPPAFEEHRDGEIFAATMFELLELMKASEPQMQFKRPAFGDGQPTRTITRGQESWERIFLGSLYILGTTAPDTFLKARDALIEADRALYPTDPSDLAAPGQHEALIWQVFAAREIGDNAKSPVGGAVTISTAVPQFALEQQGPSAPQNITVAPASAKTVRVSWQPVSGAYAYQIFKRKKGTAGQRQYKGVEGRQYFDGDQTTTGWTHVAYAVGGSTSSYEDKGVIQEFFAPAGIKSTDDAQGFNEMFDTEYAVRAVCVNANRQSGFGNLSASASLTSSTQDVSAAIKTALSNVTFANGVFEFDQTLKNNGVAGADQTAYSPINFRVVRISDPTVTVANADNGGDGRNTPAVFLYNETLAAGATSQPKRLKFNDPNAQLFTFDAVVTARVRGASQPANGSQPYDGDGGGRVEASLSSTTETFTGLIVLGSAGQALLGGVDYVDVPFVAKEGSFGVRGSLTTVPFGDVDFELRDDRGNVLATSGNLGPDEEVSGTIIPGRTYIYRIVGYGNGPSQYTITSEQYIYGSQQSGGEAHSSSFGQPSTGSTVTRLVRFTVNPLTRSVSAQILR